MKRLICLAAITVVAAVAAFANIARPEPTKTPKPNSAKSIVTEMDIRIDADAKEATLIIPKSQIKQLRAQLDEMDDASDNTAAVTNPSFSRTQTIMSGAFLSLALVFGGVWFMRSGRAASKTAKTLVIIAVAGAVVGTATFAYANAGPPAEARRITDKMFSPAVNMYGFGWGEVRVETSATEEHIKLIVPKSTATPSE